MKYRDAWSIVLGLAVQGQDEDDETQAKAMNLMTNSTPIWVDDLRDISADVEDPPGSRYLGRTQVLGASFHVEAFEVVMDGDQQVGTTITNQIQLDRLSELAGTDGPFETITWNGRQYVLLIHPFTA